MTNWTISTKLFTLAAIGGVGSIALLGWLVFQHPIRYYAWLLRKRLIWHTRDKIRGSRPWRGV